MGKKQGTGRFPALPERSARTLGYGGLGLAFALLWSQTASPHLPTAKAAVVQPDPARLLPPLAPPQVASEAPASSDSLFEITLGYPADGDIVRLLIQAGADPNQSRQAADLLRQSLGDQVDESTDIKLSLGEVDNGQGRSIERLTILSDLGKTMVGREGSSLRLLQGDAQTTRIDVPIGTEGPLGSLRDAGLDARLALEASALIERKAARARHVTAVVAERPDRFEGRGIPQLLYLSVTREGLRPLRLLRWPGTAEGWIDIARFTTDSAFMQPVAGRISSGFGSRLHPILRFLRPHQGVDYAARWGTPVRATADGRVTGAGWSGGYGRQVRIDHGNGIVTSYSHLSDMAAVPGILVRRGQVVGYVGASGFATGPHLHFEIIRNGRRIDPVGARLIEGSSVDRAAVAARLAQLRIAGA